MYRRRLLAGAGATGLLVFSGCERPKPTPVPPENKNLPPLSESDVKEGARIALQDFNRVLGLGLSESDSVPNVNLVSTLAEYQRILASEISDYVPEDESQRWAITTNPNSPNGKKIFVYKPAVDRSTTQLPDTELGRRGRLDFLAFIIGHEYLHFSAKEYKSETLHNEVFGKILANTPPLRGKKVEHEIVRGAIIFGRLEGKSLQVFGNLEEAEAILTDDLIVRKNGRPKTGRHPSTNELGYVSQIEMCKELLAKVYPDLDTGLRILAKLRSQEGGREEFAKLIGAKFNIPPEDQLFFSMSLFYAMDRGDRNLFTFYTTPK